VLAKQRRRLFFILIFQKWSKTKSKDKLNNAVFWTKPVWDKLLKDVVAKEPFVTLSIISEKLKVSA
jgi:ribosomal protein S25